MILLDIVLILVLVPLLKGLFLLVGLILRFAIQLLVIVGIISLVIAGGWPILVILVIVAIFAHRKSA